MAAKGDTMIQRVLMGAVAGLATTATGQVNALNIVVSNAISPAAPSATVTVWASFDPQYYAFARSIFSCVAAPDPGGFSNPQVLVMFGFAGDISQDQDRIDNVSMGQIHDPLAGIYADTSSPIAIWQATWSTEDFSPRNVNITLDVSDYHVYLAY